MRQARAAADAESTVPPIFNPGRLPYSNHPQPQANPILPVKFCSQCGAPVELRIPEGDTLPRFVCGACQTIHYQNPRMIVGCIPEWEDKILLCRRAIEPRHGLWTVPAGFMENGETTFQGAARETLEEANARVEVGQLYALYNIPHINQVYILFRARLLGSRLQRGRRNARCRIVCRARNSVGATRVCDRAQYTDALLQRSQSG